MIRYIWQQNNRTYLWKTSDYKKEDRFDVLLDRDNPIFVNILVVIHGFPTKIQVKLFYSDGTVLEGWNVLDNSPISLMNAEELFDGRFNV